MKKFIFIFGVALSATIFFMWLNDWINCGLILSSTANTAYKTHRLFIVQPYDELGVFGSSRALLHYIPPKLSPNSFNYGANGSAMDETLFLVKQIIRNGGNSPIIVNLDPWGWPKKQTTTYTMNYLLALDNPNVRNNLPPEMTAYSDRIPGIRTHGLLRTNLALFLNERRSTTKKIIAGASLEINSRTSEEWEKINKSLTTQDFYFEERHQNELTDVYNSTSRPIILVLGPVSPSWRQHYKGEPKLKIFLECQKQFPNVYVVDLFTTTKDWSEDLFVDPTHLNKSGAEKFTERLLERLQDYPELRVFFNITYLT